MIQSSPQHFYGSRSAFSPTVLARGFTIVEVLMASVILVVGFFSMIQAITIGSEMMAIAQRQTIASQIIVDETEKLRLKDWNYISTTLTSAAEAVYTSDSADLNASIAASGVSFTLTISVTNVIADLREVTFTVKWTKGGTTQGATTPTGSWLERLAFYRPTPTARTYNRVGVVYFTKYGLNFNAQRT